MLATIHWWIIGLFIRRYSTANYYTIDGSQTAPYPNMTDEDLDDFERFSKRMIRSRS